MSEFTVVLRTQAGARFWPGQGHEINIPAVSGLPHPLRVRMWTRWEDIGFESPVPRELVVEVRGLADGIDDAVNHFSAVARPLVALLAFSANASTGRLEAHLAFDSTQGASERDFLEVFLPDETGSPGEGRAIDSTEFGYVVSAFLQSPHWSRLGRALQQYELALRYWYFGGEYLALAHLYMAVETLTAAVVRDELSIRGASAEELAVTAGIDPYDPDRPRWRPLLDSWSRENLIFAGDSSTYQSAKKASDGFEHGFLEFNQGYEMALANVELTFSYVRRSICKLMKLNADELADLVDRPPRDVQSLRKMIRGRFLTPGSRIALPGEEYPRLEWSSSIDSVTRDGQRINIKFRENFVVRCSPDAKFQGTGFEIRGREERSGLATPGSPTSTGGELHQPLDVEYIQTSIGWKEVMRRGRSLASQAASQSLANPISPVLLPVFWTLSLQIAISESIETLLNEHRPVQALPLVRAAIRNAARFEQYESYPDSTAEVALGTRIAELERATELYDDEPAPSTPPSATALATIRETSVKLGIEPRNPDGIKASAFLSMYRNDMSFIEEVESWGDLAATLHTSNVEGVHSFKTQFDSPSLTRAAAGLCTSAVVYVSVVYAEVLGVGIDLAEAAAVDAASNDLHEEPQV